jgi:hypothetical protein
VKTLELPHRWTRRSAENSSLEHRRLPTGDSEFVDVVASVLSLRSGPVEILTQDTGMALRARTARVPCRLIDDG